MSFLSKLKEFFSSGESKETREVEIETLPKLIGEEAKKLDNKQEEVKARVKEQISESVSELREQLEVIKAINLDKKKDEQKIKLIVHENLKVYSAYIERLIRELENAQGSLKEYIEKINRTINNFLKASRMSFEKSTILVGDEVGKIRDITRNLNQKIKNIISESNELEKLRRIEEIKSQLNLISKMKIVNEEIENRIKNYNIRSKELETQKIENEADLEKLKKSSEYKQAEEKKGERQAEFEKLKHQASSMKEQADLKLLMNLFHSDEKKKKLIEEYESNFLQALEQDVKLEINEMIKTAKPELTLNFGALREKSRELKHSPQFEVDNEIESRIKELSRIEEQIKETAIETGREEKKKVKLQEKSSQLTGEIKEKARTLELG